MNYIDVNSNYNMSFVLKPITKIKETNLRLKCISCNCVLFQNPNINHNNRERN